ncbi:RNaseH domain-containing protein [Streptomyces sp. NPDC002521]
MRRQGGAGRDLVQPHRYRDRRHPALRRGRRLPYALTTARLCNHALAWEHRTRHPLPVHAAIQMDKNHPDIPPHCRLGHRRHHRLDALARGC